MRTPRPWRSWRLCRTTATCRKRKRRLPPPQVVANSGGKEQEAREQSSAVDNWQTTLMKRHLVNRTDKTCQQNWCFFSTSAAFWLSSVSYDCSIPFEYKSDHDLFCRLCAPMHALNHLLPPARIRARMNSTMHTTSSTVPILCKIQDSSH